MDAGTIVELEVTGVAHGGVFVARHEGRVVFVSDAIPGETVRARLTDTRKKSFWRAETLEVLAPSADRIRHVWAEADVSRAPEDRAGGAEFGHIALARQRALKTQVFEDALQRIGRLDDVAVTMGAPLAASGDGESADGTGWRTRVSLHVDGEGRIGPFAARSHRVVPVERLPLATPAIADAARALHGSGEGRIDLVQPSDGRVRVLPRPDGAPAPAPEVVIERVGDREFRVDAGGFWQVHRLAAHTLTALVAEGLGSVDPDAWHLDLYGGVGLFAATLGDLGGPSTRVTSVETDERATEHAGENLAEWIGARAETDRVDRFLRRVGAEATAGERARLERGVVLLDPPRAGAGREVVEGIAALGPASIVYVACDPVALARDLGTFAELGYRAADGVRAVDLFPNSHHVEAVAVLGR